MNNGRRPEPVMNAAALAAAIITLIKVLLAAGVVFGLWDLTDAEQTVIVWVATAVVDVGVIAGTMWWRARPKVTPLEDPIAADGRQLKPVPSDKQGS